MELKLSKDITVEIKYNIKSLMIFENITEHSFEVRNLTESYMLFYAFVLGNNKDFQMKWDEFLELLDENPVALVEFQEWFEAETAKQQSMIAKFKEKKNNNKSKKVK